LYYLLVLSFEFVILTFKLYYNLQKKGHNGMTNLFRGDKLNMIELVI